MSYDLLIYNGVVVTVNPSFDIIEPGVLGITGGRIVHLEKGGPGNSVPESSDTIDAGGGIVMPGMINAHSHLPMTLFRGFADDLPLNIWLEDYIFPAEAGFIRPETVHWGTLLACCEMLLSGTTTCCDGYFYEDHVAEAFEKSSMRGVLAQGVIDFPAPGVPDPGKNVQEALRYIRKWKNKSSLITPSVFCHSPYTCSGQTLVKAKKAADSNDVLFQIHLAETKQERVDCKNKYGVSPVQYLDKLGILDPHTLLVHAVWIDDQDLDIIAKRGAKISHVPKSNMKLGSGIAPLPKILKAGILPGLGTDSCASNNTLDLFSTVNMCACLHKAATLDPTAAAAETVVKMATISGAESIGCGHITGSLEPGKSADIIIVDTRKPHLTPVYSPVSHLAYAVTGADVTDVIIAGKHVVKNRQIQYLDVDEIMNRVERIAHQIKKRIRTNGDKN